MVVRILTGLAWCCIAAVASCAKPTCESGGCPIGSACNADTGLCEPSTPDRSPLPLLQGKVSLVRRPGGTTLAVGYGATEGSLAAWTAQDAEPQPSFIAGPRAGLDTTTAGQAHAVASTTQGLLHVAWLRASDGTLWHAQGTPAAWQRDTTPVATHATRDLGAAVWHDEPMLAWRSLDPPGIRFALREAGAWTVEEVPAAPLPGQGTVTVQQGASLSMVAVPTGAALAAYEALGGDLVLAVRSAGKWQVARIAGRDPTSGSDLGDMGATVALAAGTTGDLAIAYQDRSHGRVMLAMSHAGVVTQSVVEQGLQADPATGLGRVALIGTSLAVAMLADGRAVVASQDASQLRIRIAIQTVDGSFVHQTLPGNEAQLWPSLVLDPPHGVLAGWLALAPELGAGGHWRTAILHTEVAP